MFGTNTRLAELPATERHWLLIAASLAGFVLGRSLSWPLWAVTVSMALPWLPLFTRWTVRTYRTEVWLGFFFLLTALQLSHLSEHVVQMVQLHLLGLRGLDARGVFGVFDVEWVRHLVDVALALPPSPKTVSPLPPDDQPTGGGQSATRLDALEALRAVPDQTISYGQLAELAARECCACGLESAPVVCTECPNLHLLRAVLRLASTSAG
jgi:hypothetical protein